MNHLKYLCLILCLTMSLSSCSQRQPCVIEEPVLASINIIDRNGFSETFSNRDRLCQFESVDFLANQPYEKVLRIYGRDAFGDIKAYITTYHPNGLPKQYLEIVNNRAYGDYQEWHSNGVLKIEAFVIGGEADVVPKAEETWLFDGCSRAWNESGQLLAEIPYQNGVLEGLSTYFHPNGNIWKKQSYNQNQLQGDVEIYLENGQLLQRVSYANNLKNGPAIRFWAEGCIAANEQYCAGKLVSGRYYTKDGALVAQIDDGSGYRAIFGKETLQEIQQFIKGVQVGEVRVFSPNGDLLNLYHVKDDLKHGEEITYYPPVNGKLQPQLSLEWVEGRIQGIVRTWFPNGIQESQREFSENSKNGTLTAWYADGSIMMIEEYDHDKLMQGRYFLLGEKIPVSEVRGGKGTATLYDVNGNFLRKVQYVNSKPQD